LKALVWLVNTVLAQGYTLAAGHVLMTGSIGNMHPGAPGDYRAAFGTLGELTLRLN
jgi:2-keto-4-pentenoate hydratase